jgi:hypothetical protein
MARFRKKPKVEFVDAVQWFPDSSLGSFDSAGRYQNRTFGVDVHGVEYTVTEVILRFRDGSIRMHPGDWIVRGDQGERCVYPADLFAETYEEAGVTVCPGGFVPEAANTCLAHVPGSKHGCVCGRS